MDETEKARRGDPSRNEQHYRCLSPICGYEWKESFTNVECPKCGHKYLKWINYKGKGA
jgi:rubrerythrin